MRFELHLSHIPYRRRTGYVLSIMTDAVVQHQAGSKQPDPIHVSAHFLRPSSFGALEVRVSVIKNGTQNSNLHVELLQNVCKSSLSQDIPLIPFFELHREK